MEWKRLGRIFDPTKVTLPAHCRQFAQGPQALVLDDRVRIYFSTRALDESGKYLSHVAFADFDRTLQHVIAVSQHAVIPLGALGCFDEHGIFPMNVLRRGQMVYGYTCGWSRRASVSVETAIGMALSSDGGLTFQRVGDGPVLAASLREPCLVGDPFVQVFGGTFHMWYMFGLGWRRYEPGGAPERIYKIGHAVSPDGVRWTKEEARQIVSDRLGPDECQAFPTVIEIDGGYHMLFCFRQPAGFRTDRKRAYRLGHAFSDDLDTWIRDDKVEIPGGTAGDWDADMQCYPHVFECDGRILLLYNGNEFGRCGFGLAELKR